MGGEPGGSGGGPVRRPEAFDGAAADYDAYRLPYPLEVVEAAMAAGRLERGSRVLEIGCGTGQLSVDLAGRGVELVAVEMGPHLAARARRNLAGFPTAHVETGRFESWPLDGRTFDAVVAASAFHWLGPERFAKCAAALRPGGFLVILHVHHVRGGSPGFFEATQPIYTKWGLSDDPGFRPLSPAEARVEYPELDHSPDFDLVERHRIELPRTLATTAYVGWLKTDSLVLGLDETSRRGFFEDIARLVDDAYGGRASRNFVYELVAARRAGHPRSPRPPSSA